MLFDPAGRQLSRHIWSLTWPLIVANTLELVVGLIDLWLVRPFGPAATAALSIGRQVTILVETVAVAISAGVIALVSQAVARSIADSQEKSTIRNPQSAIEAVVRQSVGLVLLIGLPTTLIGYWLSEPLLVCLQARAEVRA